jgi:ribosomal protein S18 acetylase RimI-like enzyme
MTGDARIRIEAGQQDDHPWCARLMASSDPWITLGRDEASCASILRRPGSELLVARRGPERVGFLLLAPAGLAGSPYVAAIAVAPEARGHGIGTLMLRAAEERVPGARSVFLCVSDFNTGARLLYERLGYRQVGVLEDYVVEGHAELIMRKRLR